ncbi:MAG: hypothetical protein AB1941_27220 [Gemmatimonadota bacterium]
MTVLLGTMGVLAAAACDGGPTPVSSPSDGPHASLSSGPVYNGYLILENNNVYPGEVAVARLSATDQSLNKVDLTTRQVNWSVDKPGYATLGPQYACGSPGEVCVNVSAVSGPQNVWVSATVDNLTFQASLQILQPAAPISVSAISGPSVFPIASWYTWSVTASGGDGTYSYSWEHSYDGGYTWSTILIANGGSSFTRDVRNGDYLHIRVKVTSGNAAPAYSAPFLIDGRNTFDGSINGSTKVRRAGYYTYEAMPQGGSGSYTYSWQGAGSGTGKTITLYYDGCSPTQQTATVNISDGTYTIQRNISILNEIVDGC